mgnify:CR=1 FL=1
MSDEETIGLMVRLPRDLHEQVKRFSQGNGKRPRSSLNATVVFLLRAGLEAQKGTQESDSGQWEPALMVA